MPLKAWNQDRTFLKLDLTGPVFVTFFESFNMEPRKQLSLMDKIIRELDDLKNTQTSVLKKIAQIEADNINLQADVLNNGLPDLHEEVDSGLKKVAELHEHFAEYRNKYEKDNQGSLAENS